MPNGKVMIIHLIVGLIRKIDLSKLSNIVNNDVVKKTVYDKSVAKVNNIGTSGFVLKTK